MLSKISLMIASCLTSVAALTKENQILLQFLSIRPDDPNYVERFLAIRAFDNVLAVPTTTTEAYHKQELRNIKAKLAEGEIPLPPYLVNHPRRGHLPHPMSPGYVPVEIRTLDEMPGVAERIRTLDEMLLESQLDMTPKHQEPGESLLDFFVSSLEEETRAHQ